jgi:hypothetical protein
MQKEADSPPARKCDPNAENAATSIAACALALESVSPSAATLIRLVASDLEPVAGADLDELRIPQIEQLRERIERQASKALDAYRHFSDANNNNERAAVVLHLLHQAAARLNDEPAALRFARRNIVGLTADLFSDEKLIALLKTLARPTTADPREIARAKSWLPDGRYLSFARRLDACVPLLGVLGLCPNSRERGNEVETLRKKLLGAMRERREAFGLPANEGRATKRQKGFESSHSRVTTSRAGAHEDASHGSDTHPHPIAAATPGQTVRTGRGGSSHRGRR